MTNASKIGSVPVILFAVAVLAFGAFATPAYAQWDDNIGYITTGWDAGYTDYSLSDAGYTDYSLWDAGYTDYSYWDAGYTDYSYWDAGYTDYSYWDAGYTDYAMANAGYTDYMQYDIYDVYDVSGVKYSYNPGYSTPGCTSCGGFGGGSSFGGGGGFKVSPPTYSPPPSYPPSRPQPPVVNPPVKSNATTNVNTNTCVNHSCNTNVNNIDNSINGSFNTAPLTPVYTLPPQQLVQYVAPPIAPGGFCTITASPTTIQNGQATVLSWSSTGMSAWLSDGIGHVTPNGTLVARPNVSTNYVLTVQTPGGPRTCNVFVNVSGSYVSLSQIPYTGFDLGTFGNAAYWAGLLSFALAAAYLVVYYQGGMGSFVPSFAGMVKLPKLAVAKREEEETTETLAAPLMFSKQYVAREIAPMVRKVEIDNLPITRTVNAPKDAMTFESGRIVVSRN